MTRRLTSGVLVASLAWLPASAHGEPQQVGPPVATVAARELTGAIAIDGRLNDEAWQELSVYSDFHQRAPDEGGKPTEETEVRIGYDADAIYVGLRLFDTDPKKVSRQISRRDRSSATDFVTVYLDPRHDHLTGAVFTVSAAGVQADATIYNDFEEDNTWDAVWASAVAFDEQGWGAEFRIPFSQLRFSRGDAALWGINIQRYIYRRNEDIWLQLVPRVDRALASRFAHLSGVEAIKPQPHLELLPYVSTRTEAIAAEAGDPFNDGLRQFGSGGLDIKWRPTNAATLDVSFNPDFGQVEVDPEVINLTEFEVNFEEKRPFFLESAQLFSNFGRIGSGAATSNHDLFYTRRIGRSPQGGVDGDYVDVPPATTILAAGKLTGKTSSGWSFGFLDAATGSERARAVTQGVGLTRTQVEPATNYFVGRALRESDRSGSGVIATMVSRRLSGSPLKDLLTGQSLMAGYDGYRFLDGRRRWVVSGQAVASRVTGSAAALLRQQRSSRRYFQRPDADYVDLDPEATSLAGWNAGLAAQRLSGSIRPRLSLFATSPGFEVNEAGFQTRSDEFGFTTGVDYYNYRVGKFVRSRTMSLSKSSRWNFGGESQRDSWLASGSITFPSFWYVNASYSLNVSTFDDHLTRGGPLGVAPRSHSINGGFGADGRRRTWIGGGLTYGWNEAGGHNVSGYASVRMDPSSRLRLTTGPYVYGSRTVAQYFTTVADPTATRTFGNRYVFAGLDQVQLSITTRADVALSPKMSIQLYLQSFIGTGRYGPFLEYETPRTYSFLKYGTDAGSVARDPQAGVYTIDPDGAGPAAPFRLFESDFNSKTLRAKGVFRWEWRPGSTLYVAWTEGRFDGTYPGDFSLGRDLARTFSGPANDVFLIKMSYWVNP